MLSIAWYFGNRGSKYWQSNWEKHVDYIEDSIYGSLYKTILKRDEFKFWDLTNAYPFSVSRINHVLNLFAIIIWFFLICQSLSSLYGILEPFENFNLFVLIIIVGNVIGSLYIYGKSGFSKPVEKFQIRNLRNSESKEQ